MSKAKKKITSIAPKKSKKTSPPRALSPFEEMERRFEDFFNQGWLRPSRWDMPAWMEKMPHLEARVPKVDIIDRDSEVLVRAEIPGVNKKDLEVTTTENSVTVKGSTRHEEKEEHEDFYRSEISQGSFSRTVMLPCDVNNEKAKATFRDGMLELVMPKIASSKRRTVTVE